MALNETFKDFARFVAWFGVLDGPKANATAARVLVTPNVRIEQTEGGSARHLASIMNPLMRGVFWQDRETAHDVT
jgi:hypothetical protein